MPKRLSAQSKRGASKPSATPRPPDPADVLADRYRALDAGGDLHEELVVDNRVFARITDGIYRRPSSALRELLFNAYDADATIVTISTDEPRFSRMEVRDNGRGMSETALSNLVKHIGGSSKRTHRGTQIGTTATDDPDVSPAGRRLIGKIGIGLFAVAHLTTHFQIITKEKNSADWLVAEIWLKTFSEELLRDAPQDGEEQRFVTGEVVLTREPAKSSAEHGTTITLFNIKTGSQNALRKRELWESLLDKERTREDRGLDEKERQAPEVHIGFTDSDLATYLVPPAVPWDRDDSPEEKFRKFYRTVATLSQAATKNPDIDEFLDEYFAMIWRLSLAAPLDYLDAHPFSTLTDGEIETYALQNKVKGRAQALKKTAGKSVGEELGLYTYVDPVGAFNVEIDGIALFRPVELPKNLIAKKSSKPLRQGNPLLFAGKVDGALTKVEPDRGGGTLSFEAYFYWNATIIPKQNRGVLVRINDASGVLYDETFMEYQVSELNRLNQITGEIFVTTGLDAALNIDRESFNVSHPHYQYLSSWVHSALRQITNLLKEVSKKGQVEDRSQKTLDAQSAIEQQLDSIWAKRADPLESRPEINVTKSTTGQEAKQMRLEGSLAYGIDSGLLSAAQKAKTLAAADVGPVGVAKAIFGVLAAYGVLDNMTYSDQEAMFGDVLTVLMAGDKQ